MSRKTVNTSNTILIRNVRFLFPLQSRSELKTSEAKLTKMIATKTETKILFIFLDGICLMPLLILLGSNLFIIGQLKLKYFSAEFYPVPLKYEALLETGQPTPKTTRPKTTRPEENSPKDDSPHVRRQLVPHSGNNTPHIQKTTRPTSYKCTERKKEERNKTMPTCTPLSVGVGMPFHATVASVGSIDCVTQVIYIIIIEPHHEKPCFSKSKYPLICGCTARVVSEASKIGLLMTRLNNYHVCLSFCMPACLSACSAACGAQSGAFLFTYVP